MRRHKSLQDNIATTRQVVAYAHARSVSVEAELGRIGTTDYIETASDEELYTNPRRGQVLCRSNASRCAGRIGRHGARTIFGEATDDRSAAHSGHPRSDAGAAGAARRYSGTPADQIHKAIGLPKGGISKVNIATDLELGLLAGARPHRTPDGCGAARPAHRGHRARSTRGTIGCGREDQEFPDEQRSRAGL